MFDAPVQKEKGREKKKSENVSWLSFNQVWNVTMLRHRFDDRRLIPQRSNYQSGVDGVVVT